MSTNRLPCNIYNDESDYNHMHMHGFKNSISVAFP